MKSTLVVIATLLLAGCYKPPEAAGVCEQIDTAAFGGERPRPNDCAAAIRALKETPNVLE